jgi:hypothetical protein
MHVGNHLFLSKRVAVLQQCLAISIVSKRLIFPFQSRKLNFMIQFFDGGVLKIIDLMRVGGVRGDFLCINKAI